MDFPYEKIKAYAESTANKSSISQHALSEFGKRLPPKLTHLWVFGYFKYLFSEQLAAGLDQADLYKEDFRMEFSQKLFFTELIVGYFAM